MADDPMLVTAPAAEDTAKHDAWFRQQAESGLREADDPSTTWASNDEVFREVDVRLQQWQESTRHKKAS